MLNKLAIVSLALASIGSAHAASGDAWVDFASEVELSCLDATNGILKEADVVVDPFGSESYGLAIVSGEAGPGASVSIICVFDKQTKAVQIGGELEITVSPAATSQSKT